MFGPCAPPRTGIPRGLGVPTPALSFLDVLSAGQTSCAHWVSGAFGRSHGRDSRLTNHKPESPICLACAPAHSGEEGLRCANLGALLVACCILLTISQRKRVRIEVLRAPRASALLWGPGVSALRPLRCSDQAASLDGHLVRLP